MLATHTQRSWFLVASWQVVDIFLAAYICVDDCSCCVTDLVAGSAFGWGILSGIILVPDIWWFDCPVLFSQTLFFSISLFFSLRHSWLCGYLLTTFAQLQAFLSLYIAVKKTVVCRYLCVYSRSARHGYVPLTSCTWICFCRFTCGCIVLRPPDFVSICLCVVWIVYAEKKDILIILLKLQSQTADMRTYCNFVRLLTLSYGSVYAYLLRHHIYVFQINSVLKADLL